DTVRTHLAWLSEQGLVSLTDVSGCYVAEITGRGDDVASGLATVPGVKKPRARG
ncbi:TPA: ArsR family transcriptional regulator, partial [Klebsiella oxytoca]